MALFNRLADADPSDDPAYGHGKKLYMDWLLRQAKARQVHPDNLAEATLALRVFVATPKAGDLNRFKTVEALTDATLGAPRRQLAAMMAQPDRLALWQRLDGFPEASAARVDFALAHLVAADPGGGRHLPHLLRWLSDGTAPLLPEDLPRVQSHLELYLHNRQRITPAAKRDLAACATAGDLGGLIAPFRKDVTYTLEERLYFESAALATGDAVQVAETPHFRLLHITTEAGAKRLGKGTEWCTSWGDGDGRQNHFKDYADNLLYLRSKHDGSVYQLHFASWQLMDEQDHSINDFGAFAKQHPGLLETISPFAVSVVSSVLTKTAAWGGGRNIADILTFCQSYQVYKCAADDVATAVIPVALSKAASNGWADDVTSLLTFCHSYPAYGNATELAATAIPTALANAVNRGGGGDEVVRLVTFCQSHPVHNCIADSLAIPVILATLASAADRGSAADVAHLLTFCLSNPIYKSAVDPVVDTVIPTALTKATEKGYKSCFVELMTCSQSDPAWATIARAWEQQQTQPRMAQRPVARLIH